MTDRNLYGYRFAIVITSAFILLAIPFHLRPDNFIVDDGYFYPQIARNIVSGYGSTFNRVMPTNGYHPLWMLVCILAASIFRSATSLIQALGVISDALVLGSTFLFIYLCEVFKKRAATAGIAVLVFMTTTIGIWRMLEADLALVLQLLILALVVRLQLKKQKLTAMRAIFLGGLLGLALLARLDLIFFVASVYVYITVLLFKENSGLSRRLWLSRALYVGAGCCLLVIPYLLINLHEFHHLMPISGAITRGFLNNRRVPLYSFPVIIASLFNLAIFLRNKNSYFSTLGLLTSCGALLHLSYSILFGSLSAWYLTTGYLSVAFCATWLFDRFLGRTYLPMRYAVCGGLVIFTAMLSLESLRIISNFSYARMLTGHVSFAKYVEPKRVLAEKLARMLPPGSRIFMYDGPGGVAYYSGMSIIPIDGLVGSYTYNDLLLAKGLDGYIRDEKIQYVIAPVVPVGDSYPADASVTRGIAGGEIISIDAPLYHRSAGTLALRDEDRLGTFATVNPYFERTFPMIAIWRVGDRVR
jgi:hypothetical protein